MFENLTSRLSHVFQNWRGVSHLTKDNIQPILKEIRIALLEADVALEVVQAFIQDIETSSIGQAIPKGLKPDRFFLKQVNEALVRLMGDSVKALPLDLTTPGLSVILLAGLQGSGKTTLIGKLAYFLKNLHNQSNIIIATTDTQRAAAREQLKTLSEQVGVQYCAGAEQTNSVELAQFALNFAQEAAKNAHQSNPQANIILLLDTAGRLHVDAELMTEIKKIHTLVAPIETLFVVDSMTGQDAANSAKAFHAALPLTGVVLTKVDGDSRGGAALSVKYLTGKPIKFFSQGEKLDALEVFYPDRIASRILGMGDALSLIEELERKIDRETAQKLAQKIQKKQGFDFEDLKTQLKQMGGLGGLTSMASKLPGMSGFADKIQAQLGQQGNEFSQMIAVIDSMTRKERLNPDLMQKSSRKNRVARGSGVKVEVVNRVLKQHKKMKEMMTKMATKPGQQNLMRMMQGLKSKLPPGLLPF